MDQKDEQLVCERCGQSFAAEGPKQEMCGCLNCVLDQLTQDLVDCLLPLGARLGTYWALKAGFADFQQRFWEQATAQLADEADTPIEGPQNGDADEHKPGCWPLQVEFNQ